MKLVATLSGHFSEVTQVKWNSFMKKWVTASEDGTIRTWVSCEIIATVTLKKSRACLLLFAVFSNLRL
jgi:WD40 repeat protein